MKVTRKKRCILPFHLTFVILLSSCVNQNQAVQYTAEKQVSDITLSIGSKIDTTVRLKFTTPVRSIFEDSKGNFWFGSWNEGVCRFDGKQFTYFTKEDGLSHDQVRNIQEDLHGIIWFETGNGISSYDGEKITTHHDRVYNSKNEWQTEPGDLWFKGDETAGVNELEEQFGTYRYDGKEFTYLVFPIPEHSINDNNENFAVTTAVVRGKNGKLWFGTYAAVIGYDGRSFTIIDRESIGLSEDIRHLGIRAVFEDSKGNLWIGENGLGVFLYDGNTTINFTEQHRLGKKDTKGTSPALDRIFSIGEDRGGNIWFGTLDYGVWRYDGDSLTNFSEKDGLVGKGVVAIYKDKRGDLWFGGASLFKFNGKPFDRIF